MPGYSLIDWGKRHRIALLLGAVLLVGLFLRFYDLGAESIWLDEASSINESRLTVQGIADASNQPPLYFLFLRGWIFLFGTSEIAIRSLSAIFGVLAVWLVFLSGKALYNPRVGLIGAFLASFAYIPIVYSQDARAYSLLLLLSLLSYWFFIIIIRTDRKWSYPGYLFAGILLIYTHFYGLFIILSQIVFFLIFFRRYPAQRWKYFTAAAVLVAALIPFVLLLKGRMSSIASNGFWIPRPNFSSLRETFINFSAAGPARYAVCALFILLAILGFLAVRRVTGKAGRGKTQRYRSNKEWQAGLESPQTTVLLLLWLFLPVLIPFIESQLMTPIFQTKYAIGAFPALCLLVANGLNNIKWSWVFYPVLVLIVVLSSLGLQSYYRNDVKEQWREVAQLIGSDSRPEDVIVFCAGYYQSPFNYYYRGNVREVGIISLEDAQKFVSAETDGLAKNKGRVWLVLAYGKAQIRDYFIGSYGKTAVDLGRAFIGITVYRFKVDGLAR